MHIYICISKYKNIYKQNVYINMIYDYVCVRVEYVVWIHDDTCICHICG